MRSPLDLTLGYQTTSPRDTETQTTHLLTAAGPLAIAALHLNPLPLDLVIETSCQTSLHGLLVVELDKTEPRKDV